MPAIFDPKKKVTDKAREDYFDGKISASEYLKVVEASSETDRTRQESERRVKKLMEDSKIIFA